jgi:hypothetical protein
MASPLRKLSAHVKLLSQWSLRELSCSFPELRDVLAHLDCEFRERVFSPVVTFWMFLSQVLSDGASCQEMVSKALAALWLTEGKRASPDNSAYCQARKRLPESFLQRVAETAASQLECQVSTKQLWMGRRVKIVDGSSVSMPDSAANQKVYPQPKGQKRGCGFPVMRLVVVFSLATGAILRLARGSLSQSERTLVQSLQAILQAGEVLLADRGFCGFAEIYVLMRRQVHAVVRMHQNRSGARCKKKLGRGDRLVEWLQSKKIRPAWMELKTWTEIPKSLTLREITYTVPIRGFRSEKIVLVTTLTDPKLFPKKAFVELYLQRWKAELFLRDIKISLHMDVLRCKTPDMIHKELWMHVIAYNLIRSLMSMAAQRHQVCVLSMSFKSSLAIIRQWAPWMAGLDPTSRCFSKMQELLLHYLAQQLVPHRPNRIEPRARKRRPKNYPLLTAPRKLFIEIPHRNRYRRKA